MHSERSQLRLELLYKSVCPLTFREWNVLPLEIRNINDHELLNLHKVLPPPPLTPQKKTKNKKKTTKTKTKQKTKNNNNNNNKKSITFGVK